MEKGKKRIAAIGTFDGVHRGHRSVLKVLTDYARENGLEPVAITFRDHPLKLIDANRIPKELTPLGKKKKLLNEVGANPIVLEFDTPLRETSAQDWIKRLRDEFNVRTLVVGYDNTFGCDGVNLSMEDYRRIGEKEGVEVLTAPQVKGVSSSAIRRAVKEGEVEMARAMLGRPYSITAKVVSGNNLGHTLGFPTANLDVTPGVAVPKNGAYAAIVKILETGEKYPAMVNIGRRPTVMRGEDVVTEVHLIDWKGNLYDKEITVRFLKRLRDEQKFESIDALKKQLQEDRISALEIWSEE